MKKTPIYFYFTAFISGAAVMAVELSSSRLMAPYFGNSLYVWTNVIGLIMLALAIGYYFGGRISDKRPEKSLYYSFVLFTGVWTILIPFIAPLLFTFFIGEIGLSKMIILGTFVSVLLLLVVPMILLGAIVPFTVKLVTDRLKDVGTFSGKVSMISTAGSLLGTFLPAFVLIPVFGTTNTFVIIGFVLVLTAAIGLRKWWVFFLAALGLLSNFFAPPVFALDNIIYSEESPYSHIFVSEANGVRFLHTDNVFGVQSVYDPDEVLTKYYYSYFSILPPIVDGEKVLILGHAGGSFSKIFNEFYPNLDITGVELDPAMTKVAEEYMDLDLDRVNVVHADARTFLKGSNEKYDLILLDAYHFFSMPSHLATSEFFSLANDHLNENGILAVNVAAPEGEFLNVFENTILKNFKNVFAVKMPGGLNSMLVASDNGMTLTEYPQKLQKYADYFLEKGRILEFKPDLTVFTDEKITLVELLTEEMLFELISNF